MMGQIIYTVFFAVIFPSPLAILPPLMTLPVVAKIAQLLGTQMATRDLMLVLWYFLLNVIIVYVVVYLDRREEESFQELDRLQRRRRRYALTEERNRLLGSRSDAFRDIVGDSPAWEQVIESVRLVAGSDLPILIHGETGTGKERIARSIHRLSPRSGSPFVALNCSVLSAGLAESELFGHEKGAFTSAVNLRRGRFELANGGTLFLDEVGDLPAEVQPKLLRALQEGSFERVGGESTIWSDVRVIAASNVDLSAAVRDGRFREDLYYRLRVFPIELPPLRERGDDVVLLAEDLLVSLREQRYYEGLHLSTAAVECLLAYPWPGNVRELQNVIRRAPLVAGGGRIEPEHLALRGARTGNGASGQIDDAPNVDPSARVVTLDEAMRRHIARALEASSGRIYGDGGAAAMLGVKPTTLQSRMKKLGMRSG